MPTGDERVNLALKRFLSQNRMDANFMEYLDTILTDGLSRIFPASGLFTYPVNFAFPASGEFSLTPDPIEGIDDQGHVLIAEGSDRLSNISFEDDGSSSYWVGLKYIQIPSGVYANPRTGVPEYDKWADETGEVNYASDVTDLGGGSIELELDLIFPDGANHAGRVVRAYLTNPVSLDPAVAFEDLTVSFVGGHNIIQTSGSFGQGAVSPNPTSYRVACLGVSVYESVTNPFGSEYIILGEIDSSGGPSADTGDQLDLSGGGGHTLQKAYDGLGGLGSGRNITVNNEAVRLVQENDTLRQKDIYQAALRVDKATDKGPLITGSADPKDIEVGLDLKGRLRSTGMVVNRLNLYDVSGSDNIRAEEANVEVTVAGDILTFNRVGVDLQNTGNDGKLLLGLDLCEISGSIQGNDGLYLVNAVAPGSLTLLDIDFTAAALVQEVGNANLRASFWRPVFTTGGYQESNRIISVDEWLQDGSQQEIGFRHIIPPQSVASYPTLAAAMWEIYGGNFLQINNDLTIRRNGANPVRILPALSTEDIDCNDISSDGNIATSSGDITTASGDMSATGTITTAGNIESTAGSLIANQDVTAGDDVLANDDVQADANAGGAGEFTYGLAKTYRRFIFAAEFLTDDLGGTALWKYNTGQTATDHWENAVAPSARASAAVHVPIGASITGIKLLGLQNGANRLQLEAYKTTPAMADSPPPAWTQMGSLISRATTGYITLHLDLSGSPVTIAAGDMCKIYVSTLNGVVSEEKFYYAEVTYTMATVKPTH
jgi:hypothetical protein